MKPLVALIASLLPAMADASIVGTWCGDGDGSMLFIEATGMGIGEHRVCDYATRPDDAAMHKTKITCRQIYIDDNNQPVVISETTYDFLAKLTGKNRLHAEFNDGTKLFQHDYTRCDE